MWTKSNYIKIKAEWDRVLFGMMTNFQKIREFPAIFGVRNFILVFTTASYWALS
jgi:hypothetical protein